MRDFVRSFIGGEYVADSEIVAAALKKFGKDKSFQAPATELWIRQNVPALRGSIIHQSRPPVTGQWRKNLSKEGLRERFEKWYETLGDGYQKRFPDLVASELLYAINARRRQVGPELVRIAYAEAVWERLPHDDSKSVREALGDEYLDLWLEYTQEEP